MRIPFRRTWLLFAFLPLACGRIDEGPRASAFRAETVDAAGPRCPWGKSAGDIDGDGRPDLVVGGHCPDHPGLWRRVLAKIGLMEPSTESGSLVWYRNPDWTRGVLSTANGIRTDIEVADMDGDGRNDVVALTDRGPIWLKNPGPKNSAWTVNPIDSRKLHDIEAADLDGDGDLDLAARNQSGFGHANGDSVVLYRQDGPGAWTRIVLPAPLGEGLKVADIDGDGRADAVVNRVWLRNPGRLDSSAAWEARSYMGEYSWQDVFLDAGDVDGDGRMDIAASPSEPKGGRYRISWFRSPAAPDSPWTENVVDQNVETVHHFLALRDMDSDDDMDVVSAQMNQGGDPDEVKVYYNDGAGKAWRKQVLATTGSHSMRALDLDDDGDIDLFGADWEIEDHTGDYPVTLWRNRTSLPSAWNRHVIDTDRPGQAVFIEAADLDGDGWKDAVAGGFWYRNPRGSSGAWERKSLGEGAHNLVALRDLDGDGKSDFIACAWQGYDWQPPPLHLRVLRKLGLAERPPVTPGNRFVWGRNDGKGGFTLNPVADGAAGDFPQGTAWLRSGGGQALLISWHREGMGIQRLAVPRDPAREPWVWSLLSPVSQDEALSIGDVDGDGDTDLVLGTRWLRNDKGAWTDLGIHRTAEKPDRNYLVDMNGDGRPDVVVGYEAISRPGKLAWYEQGTDASVPWKEHLVDRPVGPMSLGVADVDGDGDPDLVVGEHNLAAPGNSRLLFYENRSGHGTAWRTRVLHVGDEHHDGAKLADIDNDGDLDIISIGWGHGKVLWYENPGPGGKK
jgi:hypothetical protein